MFSPNPINVSRTRMQMPAHLEEMATRTGREPKARPVSITSLNKPVSTEAQRRIADIEEVERRRREKDRRRKLEKLCEFFRKDRTVADDGMFRRGQMALVIDAFAAISGFTVAQLKSSGRSYTIARPRQRLMWILINFGPWSTSEIGRTIGRDHSTVIHGNQIVNKKAELRDKAMDEYKKIIKMMTGEDYA